jgi:hypothetical protein
VYVPGSRTGIENAPDELLTVSNVVAVALFLTVGRAGHDAAGGIDNDTGQGRVSTPLGEREGTTRHRRPRQLRVRHVWRSGRHYFLRPVVRGLVPLRDPSDEGREPWRKSVAAATASSPMMADRVRVGLPAGSGTDNCVGRP